MRAHLRATERCSIHSRRLLQHFSTRRCQARFFCDRWQGLHRIAVFLSLSDIKAMKPSLSRWGRIVLTAVVALSSNLAWAADADAVPEDKVHASIGAAVYAGPRYLGGAGQRTALVPVLSIERGIFFANMQSGIGVQYERNGFYISQSASYDPGRRESDSAYAPGARRLRGMGKVQGSATWHTVVGQQLTDRLLVSAEADVSLKSGTRRNSLRLGGEWTAFRQGADEVALDISTFWGNATFNQAYFGVSAAQSARTSFQAYLPRSGMYAYSVTSRWEHAWSLHWATTVQVTAMPYLGKLKSSPIAEKSASLEALAMVRYDF